MVITYEKKHIKPTYRCSSCGQVVNDDTCILVMWKDGEIQFYHYACLVYLLQYWSKEHKANIETIDFIMGDKANEISEII